MFRLFYYILLNVFVENATFLLLLNLSWFYGHGRRHRGVYNVYPALLHRLHNYYDLVI